MVGVDTHKHLHVAVALDELGLASASSRSARTALATRRSAAWAEQIGRAGAFGIEGTGSYGVGLASFLRRRGHSIVEVNRGDRRAPLEREVATHLTLRRPLARSSSGEAHAIPKSADGACEMIRQVKIARDTAVKSRTQALITLKCVDRQRARRAAQADLLAERQGADRPLRRLPRRARSTRRPPRPNTCSARSDAGGSTSPARSPATTACSSSSPARTAPSLCDAFGIGADTAAEMLIVFGDNPNGSAPKPPSRSSVASRRSPRPPARPTATASPAAATGRRTPPSTAS